MQKTIELNNQSIEYSHKKYRHAKNIRLIVHSDGSLVVTSPKRVPTVIIDRYLKGKADWILDRVKHFSKPRKSSKTKKEKHEEYLKYKDQAHEIAKERLGHYNTFYHLEWNRVSIKNQKTRWGSCSKKGNLNFNYKIALLPGRSADYIIVHELCHLKEMNHSQNFWDLVAKTIPDYLKIRRNLRKDGLQLN